VVPFGSLSEIVSEWLHYINGMMTKTRSKEILVDIGKATLRVNESPRRFCEHSDLKLPKDKASLPLSNDRQELASFMTFLKLHLNAFLY